MSCCHDRSGNKPEKLAGPADSLEFANWLALRSKYSDRPVWAGTYMGAARLRMVEYPLRVDEETVLATGRDGGGAKRSSALRRSDRQVTQSSK
jgi:hypothetical protein